MYKARLNRKLKSSFMKTSRFQDVFSSTVKRKSDLLIFYTRNPEKMQKTEKNKNS